VGEEEFCRPTWKKGISLQLGERKKVSSRGGKNPSPLKRCQTHVPSGKGEKIILALFNRGGSHTTRRKQNDSSEK